MSALGRSSNNSENSGNEDSEPEQRNEPIKLENKLTQNVDQLSKALLPQNINIKPIDPEINAQEEEESKIDNQKAQGNIFY